MHNNVHKYCYGRYFSKGALVLFVTLTLSGIGMLVFHPEILFKFLGVLFILIGITGFLPMECMEFDKKTMQYRNVVYFVGNDFGEWKKLPPINYVAVTDSKSSFLRDKGSKYNGKNEEITVSDYKLRLVIKIGYYIEIDEFSYYSHAEKAGYELANYLQLDYSYGLHL